MGKGSEFGAKPKGTAKHKGAKGRRVKNKNKVKTKAKTASMGVGKRQQKVERQRPPSQTMGTGAGATRLLPPLTPGRYEIL